MSFSCVFVMVAIASPLCRHSTMRRSKFATIATDSCARFIHVSTVPTAACHSQPTQQSEYDRNRISIDMHILCGDSFWSVSFGETDDNLKLFAQKLNKNDRKPFSWQIWTSPWTRLIRSSSSITIEEHHLQWPRFIRPKQIYRYVYVMIGIFPCIRPFLNMYALLFWWHAYTSFITPFIVHLCRSIHDHVNSIQWIIQFYCQSQRSDRLIAIIAHSNIRYWYCCCSIHFPSLFLVSFSFIRLL